MKILSIEKFLYLRKDVKYRKDIEYRKDLKNRKAVNLEKFNIPLLNETILEESRATVLNILV